MARTMPVSCLHPANMLQMDIRRQTQVIKPQPIGHRGRRNDYCADVLSNTLVFADKRCRDAACARDVYG